MSNLHMKLNLMELVRNERESCGTKYSNSYIWKHIKGIANRNIGHCRLVVLAINFHPTMQYAAIASSISKNYEEKKKRE
jgi:hypothetical protein